MTGFRVALGGAQAHFMVRPDLTTLGKVIGGGLPVGAYGGRADLMKHIAPEGPVYQAGTLSGNPLAVAAGLACLEEISKPGAWDVAAKATGRLTEGIRAEAKSAGVPLTVNALGTMWTAFFTGEPVFDAATARKADSKKFGRFFHALLDRGVYLPPSQFEAAFVSVLHGEKELDLTLSAVREALRSV
jgi:glutamate-1-semialdehyde 2,1-aminomutase